MNTNQLRNILFELIRPAVFIVLTIVAISFIAGRINRISEMVKERRTLYAVLQQRTETVDKIRADFANISNASISRMENAFPAADNINDFIVAMESLATASGVKQILNVGTPAAFKRYGEGKNMLAVSSITFSATMTGTVSQLLRYFRDFEALPYLASISQLTVTSPVSGWEGVNSVSVSGILYTKEIQQ